MTAATKTKRNRANNLKAVKQPFWKYFSSHKALSLFILPRLVYLSIFHYVPMYDVIIAFKDFSITKGLFGSPWVWVENFTYLFKSKQFFIVLKNSLFFSMMRLAAGFPAPIILALLLNEVKHMKFKKTA